MRGLAVHGKALQFLVRFHQERTSRSFISATRFHAYEPVLDQIRAADTVLRGDFVQRIDKFNGAQFRAINGNWCTGFKADFDFFGLIRSLLRRCDPLPHRFVGRVSRIFQLAAFMAEVPDVAVAAVNIFLALFDGDTVFLRISDGIFARVNLPLAPRRNDLQVRRDGLVCQFEPHLIVAFAGAPVREAVGANLQRNFRLALGDDRASHGSAEQIGVFIDGSGA